MVKINLSVGKIKIENINLNMGEIFGIAASNNEGKSQIIKAIMNSELDTIGYLPENYFLNSKKTLNSLFKIFGDDIYEKAKKLGERFKINFSKKANELSFSQMKIVGIINAFVCDSKIIILDSPFSGIDDNNRDMISDFLNEEKTKGKLIILTSSSLDDLAICDRIMVIYKNKVKTIDTRLFHEEFHNVTIYSKNYKELDLPMKDIKIKKQNNNHIEFLYSGDINVLLKLITKIKINDIKIRTSDIKDIVKM